MKRAELLTVIMHDIGLPVIKGVIQVAVEESEEKIIEYVTQLLGKTIDNADNIRDLLDLLEDEERDVSIRLNLATLSCHVIAAHYKRTGKLPTESELKKSVASIDQLLTFSENYIPMERLDGVFPENIRGLSPISRTVANLVYLKYYVPLVDTVAEFSFGTPETKMIQYVSEKLRDNATDLTYILLGEDISVAEQRASELLILSSLIPLYCSCHEQEKNRILALDEETRNKEKSSDQVDNIWKIFEKRLSMLTILAKHIMPDHFSDDDIGKIENLFTDGKGLIDIDEEDKISKVKKALLEDSDRRSSDEEDEDEDEDDHDDEMYEEDEDEEDDLPIIPLRGEKPQQTIDDEDEDEGESESSGGGPMSFFKGD